MQHILPQPQLRLYSFSEGIQLHNRRYAHPTNMMNIYINYSYESDKKYVLFI